MTAPVISIQLMTYNHGPYVRRALEGIFEQKIDVPFEVIVTEDASTDDTRAILEEYRNRYPDIITILAHDKNKGGKFSLLEGFSRCRGDYIIIFDGDDYWCDPDKLRMQLEMLQADPELVGCGHNTALLYTDGHFSEEVLITPERRKNRYALRDLIEGRIYLHTSAILYRNVFKGGLPEAQHHLAVGDYFMSMLFAEHGDIGYIDRIMSVYRKTGSGEWSRFTALEQRMRNMDALLLYNQLLGYKYAAAYDLHIFRSAAALVKHLLCSKPHPLYFLKYGMLAAAYFPAYLGLHPITARMADRVMIKRLKTLS